METTEEGWVTDQRAIDVIVELKGLQPGDQVRIVNGEKYALGHLEGQVVTLTEHNKFTGTRALEDHGAEWSMEPVVAHFDTNWVICRGNIGAWRRPTKKGG